MTRLLVGGLEHGFYFPQPDWGWWSNLTSIFFRGIETTNQFIYIFILWYLKIELQQMEDHDLPIEHGGFP